MLSLAYQGATCVIMGLKGALGVGVEARKRLTGEGAVNTQHGTGMEGSSHPCTEGCQPK
jgi:hypothetical protein